MYNGHVKRKTLYFTAPRQVELREESLPALGTDEVLVETTCSAISAGTEMLVYQGRFPREMETDSETGDPGDVHLRHPDIGAGEVELIGGRKPLGHAEGEIDG